ncbi:glycosyl transferase family 1 [Dyella acidisoli]|uniref:Glycosyl transferase family 1 n=2 Tax=Dyella acidisoli TaxID=1867834 RepID=A0ABQ5XNA2_9GAMM|nr:glycosyl transferase family 1 [Dyella acidisoli]
MDCVEVVRFRYAPRWLQTLVNHGGIVGNLRHHPWKWLLVPGFVLCQYLAARRLVRTRKIDLIHAHWLIPQGLIARRLKKVAAVPYIVTSHGGDLYGLRGALLGSLKQKVAKASSSMTVVSTAMQAEVTKIGLQPPSLAVLPMGVDLRNRFSIDSSVERVENELLFVGRLVAKKGLPALLKAMPAVLRQRPSTVLTIAGFGPEEASLRSLVRSLGIESQVSFRGAMSQEGLPELYRRATVFVAPFVRDSSGNQEGLPVVLMEAIGCGCPVVVGNVPGIQDLLGDAAPEICVDPADTHAFAEAILAALENPKQAQERAYRIRNIAAGSIDWDVIADGYARVIQQCLLSTARDLS